MRKTLAIMLLATAATACTTSATRIDNPARGLAAVNVPLVTRSDYALDLSAPDGSLSPSEAARLDGWFSSLALGYGDSVHVDGAYADAVRADVAQIAGRYGMLLSASAPVTAGAMPDGSVRVIVSRTRASVPNCPNWDRPASPDYENQTTSNYGCAVSGNMAAMVADPRDLVHGREGSGVTDAATSGKAIGSYRSLKPTGEGGLQDVNTKGGN